MRFSTLATGAALLAAAGTYLAAPAYASDPAYFRVDTGIAFSSNAKGDIFNGTGFGQDFGHSAVIGFGVGKPLLSNMGSGFDLRAELQATYHPSFGALHSAPNPANTTILSTSTDIRSWTVMGNLYADMVRGDFRPYIGVGAGVAMNHLNTLTYFFNTTQSATEPGTDKSRFAWSLMAGLGLKVDTNATLDFGYKYLDAGKIDSSGQVTLAANGATFTQPPLSSKLRAHEITIGLRYNF